MTCGSTSSCRRRGDSRTDLRLAGQPMTDGAPQWRNSWPTTRGRHGSRVRPRGSRRPSKPKRRGPTASTPTASGGREAPNLSLDHLGGGAAGGLVGGTSGSRCVQGGGVDPVGAAGSASAIDRPRPIRSYSTCAVDRHPLVVVVVVWERVPQAQVQSAHSGERRGSRALSSARSGCPSKAARSAPALRAI